ncbi:putative B3 domain-containing protein Os04g0347400 isoform X2 [Ananas comosus]|uniref:B3 domain-containing protein Os04g0347400 isoform X2 n=1 Tax=Ananas comosus TaxID=4615 RepID=A0A6P5GDU7_ANACO|nr:putative B3 domain-containing protein Os04g0347400 isoform X2 [Ananas comosus]
MGSHDKPQFVKVLLPEFLEKLPIPDAIAQLLMHQHNGTATLFSPLGKFWHIALEKDADDNTHFSNGWREFSRAHDFTAGDFLLFRYEGNMVFKVKVFDVTGCRKQYDRAISEKRSFGAKDEILEDVCDGRRKRGKPTAPKEQLQTPPGFLATDKSATKNNRAKTVPHFEKIIRPYNFSCGHMSVPRKFCASNGLTRKEEMVLEDPKRRSWHVKLWHGVSDSRLLSGWKEFSAVNKLEEGDKCTFQLVSDGILRVLIQKRRA